MALFKAQLSAGPFRRGEIVDIEPDEFANYIARGWLKPHGEGHVIASPGAEDPAPDAPTDDASSPPPQDDAPPSEPEPEVPAE